MVSIPCPGYGIPQRVAASESHPITVAKLSQVTASR